MNRQSLLSWVLMFILAFGFSLDADAQKKKKKKKKKKGQVEQVAAVLPDRIIDSDRSEICDVFAGGTEPTDADLARISQNFADMNLRRQVKDYGPGFQSEDGEFSAWYYWKRMYEEAPGFSILVYTDGSAIFRELAAKAQEDGDEAKFQEYADRALDLLEEGEKCYPETKGKFGPAKAYIYELLYPNKFETIFELYTDGFGEDTDPYSLMSITRYALYMGLIDKISVDEAKGWLEKTRNLAKTNAGDKDFDYALEVIDLTWTDQYEGPYAEKADYENKVAQQQQAQQQSQQQQSSQAATGNAIYNEMLEALEKGDVNTGMAKFNEYMPLVDDVTRQYQVSMYVGQTLYNLQDFPKARSAFQKAASYDPSQGDPYYFIGSMYLSSGPMCGPGTGFDSQRVIWPAFDKYQTALAKPNLTPDFRSDIASTISTYTQYLPTDAQLSAEGLSVGSSYTVPCWINEVTTVRSSATVSN